MESVKEEFEMFMKTFIDFEREVLVDVSNGENCLSSALSVTDFWMKEAGVCTAWPGECQGQGTDAARSKGILTVLTMQNGMEMEWVIHYNRIIREGSRFVLEGSCGEQARFLLYELFSEEDPYWE